MLSKLLGRIKRTPNTVAATSSGAAESSDGFLYAVTLPNQETVMLRAKNLVTVKALVREANNLTRLPAGTTVERVH